MNKKIVKLILLYLVKYVALDAAEVPPVTWSALDVGL